jgi:hypothetical protein
MHTGDKAPTNTAIIYQGPHLAEKYEENKEYQDLASEGMRLAAKGKHEEAVQVFTKASKVNRVALPSYYVMLELAKSEYALNNKEGCKRAATNFICSAEIELSPARNDLEFVVVNNSEARLRQLKADIVQAKVLLEQCQR